jgi:hypothetical protein
MNSNLAHTKLFIALFSLAFLSLDASAQQTGPAGVDILPAKSLSEESVIIDEGDSTHPTMHLTPDKSDLVRLEAEAASIIIGNPAHLSILAENSKTLVLVPKMPGATYFSVLDDKGDVVMQRHVIVASPKEKYVRIRKSCASAGSGDCMPTQVYYCPDMCHEINIAGPDSGSESASAMAGSAEDMAKTTAGDGVTQPPTAVPPVEDGQ